MTARCIWIALRQRLQGKWLVQLRSQGRPLYRTGQCGQLEGMGKLGQAQLDWLKQDLGGLYGSTPIVVFAHIPLWTVYPNWGWGTSDSEEAFAMRSDLARSPC